MTKALTVNVKCCSQSDNSQYLLNPLGHLGQVNYVHMKVPAN